MVKLETPLYGDVRLKISYHKFKSKYLLMYNHNCRVVYIHVVEIAQGVTLEFELDSEPRALL